MASWDDVWNGSAYVVSTTGTRPIVEVVAATNDARLTASTRALMSAVGDRIESSNVANVKPAFSAAWTRRVSIRPLSDSLGGWFARRHAVGWVPSPSNSMPSAKTLTSAPLSETRIVRGYAGTSPHALADEPLLERM